MSTAQLVVSPTSSPPAAGGAAGAYQARKSNKTARTTVRSDGAIWKERLAVCEGVTDEGDAKLTVRSYYRNQVTQERVWDEPPSGASEVIFASSEQRKKADLQKQEMQLTLDELPPDVLAAATAPSVPSSSKLNNSDSNNGNTPDAKKKGLFGRFGKKNKERPFLADDSKDLNLQRAIALSVAEANGNVPFDSDPVILYDTEPMPPRHKEDEDLALAKALSMSSSSLRQSLQPTGMTEEELLQQALEASRLDEKRVPTFDPYAPVGGGGHEERSSRSDNSGSRQQQRQRPQQQRQAGGGGMIEPPHKMESDEGKKKPGRSMKRRVFGGRKTIETKAGVV